MAKKVNMACPECEADFTLTHDMEPRLYKPQFCAFCGEDLGNDEGEFFMEEEED